MIRPYAREVLASAVSQRAASIVTVLLLAVGTATVLVTAGRNAGAEAAVLSQIDAAGTRTLSIYGKGKHPEFSSRAVAGLARYDVVADVVGFGPVVDATGAAVPDGTRVGMRTAYGSIDGHALTEMPSVGGTPQTLVTHRAARALGLSGTSGSVRTIDGADYLVGGLIELPDFLQSMEPSLIVPESAEADEPLASMIVVADSPQDLPLVTRLVESTLSDVPREDLVVESSQAMADLREAIGGELTRQSRGVILGVVLASTSATLVTVWSLALMRRRDFGRRRALGATRSTIVALLVTQTVALATGGALLGCLVGAATLLAQDAPLPPAGYVVALAVTLIGAAALAAVLPAVWASRRDPLVELRVA